MRRRGRAATATPTSPKRSNSCARQDAPRGGRRGRRVTSDGLTLGVRVWVDEVVRRADTRATIVRAVKGSGSMHARVAFYRVQAGTFAEVVQTVEAPGGLLEIFRGQAGFSVLRADCDAGRDRLRLALGVIGTGRRCDACGCRMGCRAHRPPGQAAAERHRRGRPVVLGGGRRALDARGAARGPGSRWRSCSRSTVARTWGASRVRSLPISAASGCSSRTATLQPSRSSRRSSMLLRLRLRARPRRCARHRGHLHKDLRRPRSAGVSNRAPKWKRSTIEARRNASSSPPPA